VGGVEQERAEWEDEEDEEEEDDLSSRERREEGSGGRKTMGGSISMEVGGEEKGV
jgi:hypothetical protein